ncbi:MAG: nucleotidyltransferase domain-containing protein, partial [Peptococcaceae bacterium]|nr:nucleotidyltransferase domain-containing protein [Peptococcaceae bacterium]
SMLFAGVPGGFISKNVVKTSAVANVNKIRYAGSTESLKNLRRVNVRSSQGSGVQGLTEKEFENFSEQLRSVLKKEGVPGDNVFVHGSRARGTAAYGADIDVKVILSNKDFGKIASRRIATTTGKTRNNVIKQVRNEQKINARGISRTFETSIWNDVYPTLPDGFKKVQVSIMTKGSSFNTNPSVRLP